MVFPPPWSEGDVTLGKSQRESEDPQQGRLQPTAAGASKEKTRSASGAVEEPALPSLGLWSSETHLDFILQN